MALTKIARTDLFAIASTSSNSVSLGTRLDVSTYYEIALRIRLGRGTGTGFTTAPILRVEGSALVFTSTPNADQWAVLAQYSPALGASIGNQAVSGTVAAGQATELLAAGTNFAAGDYVFQHNTTLANSEWSRVLSISSATLTLEENLVNAQTGATCRNQAEQYAPILDLTGYNQLRLVVNGYGTGQAVIVHADFGAVSGL